MRIGIIADRRFLDDLEGCAIKSQDSWDNPPRYLLGRLISHHQFSHDFALLPADETLKYLITRLEQCDYGIIHYDATVLPEHLLNLKRSLSSEFSLVNRGVSDIRKSVLQSLLKTHGQLTLELDRNIKDDSVVFVKSDYNAGDAPRRFYSRTTYKEALEIVRKDPTLIVQPFIYDIPEAKSGYLRLRRFVIVGSEVVQIEYFSKEPVIKRSTSVWQYSRDISNLTGDLEIFDIRRIADLGYNFTDLRSSIGPRLESTLAFVSSIGCDFASVDVITPAWNSPYILDINPTPWERGIPDSLVRLLGNALMKLVGTD